MTKLKSELAAEALSSIWGYRINYGSDYAVIMADFKKIIARETNCDTLQAELETIKESRAVISEQEQVSRNEANRLRAELDEWKQICRNRDITVKEQGEEWVKLKEKIDTLTQSLNSVVEALRLAFKQIEHNEHGRVYLLVKEVLAKHPPTPQEQGDFEKT